MVEAITFALAIFFGWFLFDVVKEKRVTKENLLSSLLLALIAGVGWYVIGVFFSI